MEDEEKNGVFNLLREINAKLKDLQDEVLFIKTNMNRLQSLQMAKTGEESPQVDTVSRPVLRQHSLGSNRNLDMNIKTNVW